MEHCVDVEELKKATAVLAQARSYGFSHSLAIFKLVKAGPTVSDFRVRFENIILQAHPTDESRQWGRADKSMHGQIIFYEKWDGEKLVELTNAELKKQGVL